MFNYFGQGAWILKNQNNPEYQHMEGLNPFFQMMDPNVRYVAVILSVTAGIIASQALITGAFTMVSEATGLNWMPHLQVRYPARTRGQLYIPVINWVLCAATLIVLGIFRDSEHISAAYGLALTITMITTTILLAVYMWYDRKRVLAVVFTIVFLAIQLMFFIASMAKFLHGGWFTMLLTLAILFIMYTWNEGTRLERAQRRHMMPKDFLPALDRLHGDFRIPYFADNIVYLTSDSDMRRWIRTSSSRSSRIIPSAPVRGGRCRCRPPTNRSRASTPCRISARATCSECVSVWDSRCRSLFRCTCTRSCTTCRIPVTCRSRSPVYPRWTPTPEIGTIPLRADSQGPDAGIQDLHARRDVVAGQVRDSSRRRLPDQMVRPGAVQPVGRGSAAVHLHSPTAASEARRVAFAHAARQRYRDRQQTGRTAGCETDREERWLGQHEGCVRGEGRKQDEACGLGAEGHRCEGRRCEACSRRCQGSAKVDATKNDAVKVDDSAKLAKQ